ncbi:MAG: ammonium transporter, partial [Pseudomonadota bacterium]
MKLTKYLYVGAAMMLLPTLALAQDEAGPVSTEEFVWIMNSLLFLIGGFLVFFMAAGFAMLEGGLVRSKNVTMQMTKNVALFSIAAIMYWLIGYNLMYPLGDWAIEGYFSGLFPSVGVLEAVGLGGEGLGGADDAAYASTGSDYIFQLMFCAATASIVSGALAERIKLWPFLIFTAILTGFIYPLTASWQWGGGWLSEMGFSDFAGSTVVHACGAAAALAGALVLGPRLGKYKDGKVN